jgi:hypothetical protein
MSQSIFLSGLRDSASVHPSSVHESGVLITMLQAKADPEWPRRAGPFEFQRDRRDALDGRQVCAISLANRFGVTENWPRNFGIAIGSRPVLLELV